MTVRTRSRIASSDSRSGCVRHKTYRPQQVIVCESRLEHEVRRGELALDNANQLRLGTALVASVLAADFA